MTTENNFAAQAGDEPMDYAEQLRAAVETVCEGWTLPPGARKTLETALWAPRVSPRATADVELRDLLNNLRMSLPDVLPQHAYERFIKTGKWAKGSSYARRGDTITTTCRSDDMEVVYAALDAANQSVATTKPGA